MTNRNLWGDLPSPAVETPPAQILQEQGDLLGKQMNFILSGEVTKKPAIVSDDVEATFHIVARALDNYHYSVCRAKYDPASPYPAELRNLLTSTPTTYTCNSEEEFLEALAKILQSDALRKVLAALLREAGVTPKP